MMSISEVDYLLRCQLQKCSKTHINQASSQSSTASVASPYKFGIVRVLLPAFSPQRTHQTSHWSGHTIFCARNHGYQRYHRIRDLSGEWEGDTGNKIAILGHDHQERRAIVMQLKKYFTFEVQVLDDKNVRRRFRASNYQSTTRVKPFICTMPMRLDEGTSITTQAGTKSSSISLISLAGPTEATTLKL